MRLHLPLHLGEKKLVSISNIKSMGGLINVKNFVCVERKCTKFMVTEPEGNSHGIRGKNRGISGIGWLRTGIPLHWQYCTYGPIGVIVREDGENYITFSHTVGNAKNLEEKKTSHKMDYRYVAKTSYIITCFLCDLFLHIIRFFVIFTQQ